MRSASLGSSIPSVTEKPFISSLAPWRSVGTHQHLVPHNEAGVKDFLTPLGRHVLRGRRALVREHRFDFAPKNFFIELECCLALAVEKEIRIQLHGVLLWL